jgi:hypothetical protein
MGDRTHVDYVWFVYYRYYLMMSSIKEQNSVTENFAQGGFVGVVGEQQAFIQDI